MRKTKSTQCAHLLLLSPSSLYRTTGIVRLINAHPFMQAGLSVCMARMLVRGSSKAGFSSWLLLVIRMELDVPHLGTGFWSLI